MYAVLNLIWVPEEGGDATMPAGQAPAIVRGDTYVHNFEITDGWAEMGAAAFAAQIRAAKISTGASPAPEAPIAEFTTSNTQDGDNLIVQLRLEAAVTLELPASGVWDLEMTLGGDLTTMLSGKVKVVDDVTRVA